MGLSNITKWLAKKIRENLPSQKPETEEELRYEEGKKRIYALHEKASQLFYVENVWLKDEKLHLYGSYAKGEFVIGCKAEGLDNYGLPIFAGTIEEILEERPDGVKVKRGFFKAEPKTHLVLSDTEKNGWDEDYLYTNYLISLR